MKDTPPSPNFSIIEVWNSNLDEEFKKIRKIVQKYPFIAMVSHNKLLIISARYELSKIDTLTYILQVPLHLCVSILFNSISNFCLAMLNEHEFSFFLNP